ncbi:MAG: class I SAM-dependent methyltransferase [Clostridia bacterium]|nr:class I SAM-dependent methyltransferase [Clostridia bacterium]
MKERFLDNVLDGFYKDSYVEEDRLTSDRMHYIEFITTTHYIDKYLKQGDRILEVGAGTGAYSLYYANKGYQVDALELVQANVDVMKNKIKECMNINVIHGNALDLSMYDENTFDVTLVLGPLYHLFKKEEEEQAIKEAIRVTKPNGKILIAFILFDLTMLTWGFQGKNIYENYGDDKQVSIDFKPNNSEDLIFNMRYFDEVKELMNKFEVKKLCYVATDGVGRVMREEIDNMNDEEYKMFVNYHLSICEREDLIGYSGHILSIVEK